MRYAAIAITTSLMLCFLSTAQDEPGFTSLFNGKDFSGWTKAKQNEDTFTIKDGAIVTSGPHCHLFYTGPFHDHMFKNFELRVDVMTKPSSNGGIYFDTAYQEQGFPKKGFEAQVNTTSVDWRKTGSLYEVQDIKEQLEPDNKWFTESVIVQGKHVTISLDGKKCVDWTQPDDWNGTKDFVDRRIREGTIALQAHDPKSVVYYKNIRIKLLP